MGSVKTDIVQVQQLYERMDSEFEKLERAHAIGEFALEQPILDLAQRVISTIDRLMPSVQANRQQRRLSMWRDDAEAVCSFYSPIKPSQYSPETLVLARNRILYSMGVIPI